MGGGAYLYRVYGAEAIRPVYVSKITTTVQMIFLIWLFVCALAGWHPQKTYYVFVAVMVLLMGMTIAQYLMRVYNEQKIYEKN